MSRNEEKEKNMDVMMDEMVDGNVFMKNKSAVTIITKALKATDDEEVKQKLRDKLVQLALDLD